MKQRSIGIVFVLMAFVSIGQVFADNVKYSELPSVESVTGTESFAVNQGGVSKGITLDQVLQSGLMIRMASAVLNGVTVNVVNPLEGQFLVFDAATGTFINSSTNAVHWEQAYNWGNHATQGYLTAESDPQVGNLSANAVPRWNGSELVGGSVSDDGSLVSVGKKLKVTVTSGGGAEIGASNNTAAGIYALAAGSNSSAGGDYATSLGVNTTASGGAATAMGSGSTASGLYSTAIGVGGVASNQYAFALGGYTTASGLASIAMGYLSSATASYSIAMGRNTKAYQSYSTALGYSTTASGLYSTAMGRDTSATGAYATAMGGNSTASNSYSTAIGGNTIASGTSSTAMGSGTVASGDYTTAIGLSSTASGNRSTAMGGYATASGYYSLAFGYQSEASGNYAASLGKNSSATGSVAIALGQSSVAGGDGSVAFGTLTKASGFGSTAMGYATTASGSYASSLGRAITVNGEYSVGVGLDATARTVTANNTFTVLGGNAGFGTVAPAVPLETAGIMRSSLSGTPSSYVQMRYDGSNGASVEGSNATMQLIPQNVTMLQLSSSETIGVATTGSSVGNILTVKQGSSTDPIADSWTTYSTLSTKDDVQPLDLTEDLERGSRFDRFEGVSYRRKLPPPPQMEEFISHVVVDVTELVDVSREVVTQEEEVNEQGEAITPEVKETIMESTPIVVGTKVVEVLNRDAYETAYARWEALAANPKYNQRIQGLVADADSTPPEWQALNAESDVVGLNNTQMMYDLMCEVQALRKRVAELELRR